MIKDTRFISRIRVALIAFFIFIFFTVIAIRLWFVQVRRGESSREQVSRQYVRNIRVPALRGRIVSAEGIVLAGNRVSYDLIFHLSEMRQPGRLSKTINHILLELKRVAKIVGRPVPFTRKDLIEKINRSPGLPLQVFTDLDQKELALASEYVPFVPGMEVIHSPVRTYPFGPLACHLLGNVKREDPYSADDRTRFSYYVSGTRGSSGLELACDTWLPDWNKQQTKETAIPELEPVVQRRPLLRGSPGKQLVVVDHLRFIRHILEPSLPSENGKDIVLTLEFRAQKIAEKLIRGMDAAFVLLDASNGTVLAMASMPQYSPAEFVPGISKKRYQELLNEPGRPLMNKATQGVYSPGSIVKPLMGLAIQENGIPADRSMTCDGATWFGSHPLNCWIRPLTGGGHGTIDLHEAITVSCNDYFAETIRSMGIQKITPLLESAGIGRKTGFILPESAGRLPSVKHKKHWTEFDSALVAIGQGDILITPLQAAVYTAAIANGGTVWVPRLLDRILDSDGNIVHRWNSEKRGKLAASDEHLEIVRDAMHDSIHTAHGGTRNANTDVIDLSGKTGTAEVGSKQNRHKNTWCIAFGTDQKSGKIYACAVFVGHGVSGGKTAAPIIRQFFEEYIQP